MLSSESQPRQRTAFGAAFLCDRRRYSCTLRVRRRILGACRASNSFPSATATEWRASRSRRVTPPNGTKSQRATPNGRSLGRWKSGT